MIKTKVVSSIIILSAAMMMNACVESSSSVSSTSSPTSSGSSAGVASSAPMIVQQTVTLSGVLNSASSLAGNKPSVSAENQRPLYRTLAKARNKAKNFSTQPSYVSSSGNCLNGSMSTDVNDTLTKMTFTFYNCNDGYTTTNGTMSMSFSGSMSTITFGDGDTIAEESDFVETYSDGYKSIMSMVMTDTSSTDGSSGTASVNGIMKEVAANGDSFELIASNLNMSFSSTATQDISTMNGSMKMTDTANTEDNFKASFTNYTIKNNADNSYEMSGTVTISESASDCMNGKFTFTTIEPVFDDLYYNPVGGKITINGNTVEYFQDGSVQITDSSGSVTTYTSSELSANVCAAA